MQVIGFAEQYYTLWDVSVPYRKYINNHDFFIQQDYTYIQNLSKDLDKAEEKIEGEYRIDLTLRGEQGNRFTNRIGRGTDLKSYQFPTGLKCEGEDIRTCNDESALWVMYLKKSIWSNEGGLNNMHSFRNLNPSWVKPCVYARRRLIELGVIERYDGQYMTPEYMDKYIARKEKELKLASAVSGHHFNEGDRLDLNIIKVSSFSFEGTYGTTFIVSYKSDGGLLLKYMGSTPPNISNSEFTSVKATIKHAEYKGVKETRLQRIKL